MSGGGARRRGLRLSLLAGAVLAAILAGYGLRGHLDLEYLAGREEELRAWKEARFGAALAACFLAYVAIAALSLPGAALATLFLGWFLGLWWALPVVGLASATGASCAFLLSRFLFREALLARFGARLERFNRALEAEGAFYLFTLRLIPAAPFFVINLAMGLTPLRLRTFFWVSLAGMLPGTFVYLNAGASLPRLSDLARQGAGGVLGPGLILSFLLIGLLPLAARRILRRLRPVPSGPEARSGGEGP